MELFVKLFLIVTALSIILNVIFKTFDLPTIIGYIITGICLSNIYGLSDKDALVHVAEFGIVFLMFTIGLEFSFKHLMRMKKEVFFNGILQVLSCGVVITLLVFQVFNMDEKISVIVGCALALSSTAVVLKILNDSGDINQIYGRKALGILLFQDIAVIPLLLMVDIFGSTDAVPVNYLILKTIISALIVFALLFVIGKYVLNRVLYLVIKTDSQEIFIAAILFIVVGASFIAHIFGFSYTLGAFIAGMMMAETQYKHEIEVDLIPFRDILLGLFFITVGMQISFDVVFDNWLLIFFIVFVIMAIKVGIIYVILVLQVKKRNALKAAFSICQIGEFGLAVLALLISNAMIDKEDAQILITATVVSMIIAPFILKNLSAIANKFEREDEAIIDDNIHIKAKNIRNHFIVCGYGRLGQEVVRKLKTQGIIYIVIESDLTLVQLGRSRGENVFFGNMSQKATLEDANIRDAASIIITVSNEQKLELIAKTIQSLNLDSETVVRYSGTDEKNLFSDFGPRFRFIKEERAVARVLVHEALQSLLEKQDREP